MGRDTDTSAGSKRKAPSSKYEGKEGFKKAKNDYSKSTFTKRRSDDAGNEDGGARKKFNKFDNGDKAKPAANGFNKPSETG
jgi:hypothetical protein